MRYEVFYTDSALEDLKWLKQKEPTAYKKALKLIEELYEHPKTGTGHPEPLKGDRTGQWSRRITGKHRRLQNRGAGVDCIGFDGLPPL